MEQVNFDLFCEVVKHSSLVTRSRMALVSPQWRTAVESITTRLLSAEELELYDRAMIGAVQPSESKKAQQLVNRIKYNPHAPNILDPTEPIMRGIYEKRHFPQPRFE